MKLIISNNYSSALEDASSSIHGYNNSTVKDDLSSATVYSLALSDSLDTACPAFSSSTDNDISEVSTDTVLETPHTEPDYITTSNDMHQDSEIYSSENEGNQQDFIGQKLLIDNENTIISETHSLDNNEPNNDENISSINCISYTTDSKVNNESNDVNTKTKLHKKKLSPIEKHFSDKKMEIFDCHKPENLRVLKNLTMMIANNYELCYDFFKCIKRAVASNERHLVYRLDNNAAKNKAIKILSSTFSKFKIFSSYTSVNNTISACIPHTPKITAFLNGYWLELFSGFSIQNIIEEISEKYGYKTEVLMNLKLRDSLSEQKLLFHEIDVVFSVNDKVYAVEVKSGKFDDYDTLYKTRSELGFIPDHYLLIRSEALDTDTEEMIHYFYEYYVTDIKNMKTKISEMTGIEI